MYDTTVMIVDYRYLNPGQHSFLKMAVLDRGASAGSKGYNDEGDGRWEHVHRNSKGKSFRPDKPFLAWLINAMQPYWPMAHHDNNWSILPRKGLPKPIAIKEMDVAYEMIIRIDRTEPRLIKQAIEEASKPDWFSIISDHGSNSWNINTKIVENGYNLDQDVNYDENPDLSRVQQRIVDRYDELIAQLAKSLGNNKRSVRLALGIHIQQALNLDKPFSTETAPHGLLRQVNVLIEQKLLHDAVDILANKQIK